MLGAPQPRFRFYNGLRNYRLALRDVFAGRVFTGNAIAEAEARLAERLGVAEAILTQQGRHGIYLGLCETIRPGQDVILSPYTLYDVVNMVVAAGGVPVFADVEEETCNISVSEVERLIGPRTGAVLVTHLHGLAASIEPIRQLCEAHDVPLLEDACQAFGARYNDRSVGTLGTMGFFSFGRAKNVNAFLGGMIATNDAAKASRVRDRLAGLPFEDTSRLTKRVVSCGLSQFLTSPLVFSAFTYWVFRYGTLNGVESVTRQFNTEVNPVLRTEIPETYQRRISQMQARLVTDQLDRVDANSRARIDIAKAYHVGLCDLPGIVLPPARDDFSHIYLSYPIQVEDRGALQRHMMRHGRDVGIQHIGNTADYACFKPYARGCPRARRTAARVLLLPTYPGYRKSEALANIDAISSFFRRTASDRLTQPQGATETI